VYIGFALTILANKTVIPGRDLIVRCGSEGPLFPVSVLEVLPGRFWKQKTDLADIASHDPLDNYNTITQEGARIFGFQANGPDSQGTTLVSTPKTVLSVIDNLADPFWLVLGSWHQQ